MNASGFENRLMDIHEEEPQGGLDPETYSNIPYESPILGQVLDLISPPKTNISEPRFESYDPGDMAN